ncbi:hypothetical protein [Stieleria varia]|uniref:Lipoprotein n=1 Tax=Stieleria varia TaxID=2528005 RepID=A0A5C5ZIE8_9BACT|nr:hypothetical protein [Stieleria varia]TWT87016.1 hypothetical protein Pla52n_70410 [Stieleria varia]
MRLIAFRSLTCTALACAAVVALSGCESATHQTRQVSSDDKRIASETVEFVQSQVASNGELARRHGDFESLEIRSIRRLPPFDVFDVHEPAKLLIECLARFERFSTKIEVHVFDGATFNILMMPTEEFATKKDSPLSDCKLVQDGDQLWFVRTGGDQMRVQSIVTCQISHPDFEP